jgi:hypothetical protein
LVSSNFVTIVIFTFLRFTVSDYLFGIFKLCDHCNIYLSKIYSFWLPLWYLQTLWLWQYLPFQDLQFLITSLVSSNFVTIVIFTFLRFTVSDYLFGIFKLCDHCNIYLSKIYSFWLPLWYLQTLWPL